jgi:hypothetical protein
MRTASNRDNPMDDTTFGSLTRETRIPEEIRSRLADEVERFSQKFGARTGVPISISNLIKLFVEDFMDAMESEELPEWPIRIQRSTWRREGEGFRIGQWTDLLP